MLSVAYLASLITVGQLAVALVIATAALRGYGTFGSRTLLYLSISFYLVGAGVLLEGASPYIVGQFGSLVLLTGLAVEALGYFCLAVSHFYTVRQELAVAFFLPVPLLVGGAVETPFAVADAVAGSISFFLLLYILAETIIFVARNRNPGALLPIVGFGLMTASLFTRLFLVTLTPTTLLVDLLKLLGLAVLAVPVAFLVLRRGRAAS